MAMRSFKDVNGYVVHQDSVGARDAYSGMLEGNPYLARKFRLLRSTAWMKHPGNHVFGLVELEREIAGLDMRCVDWAPREEWSASLSDDVDFGRSTVRVARVSWFQEGGDPMSRLTELVEGFDFLSVATQVKAEVAD